MASLLLRGSAAARQLTRRSLQRGRGVLPAATAAGALRGVQHPATAAAGAPRAFSVVAPNATRKATDASASTTGKTAVWRVDDPYSGEIVAEVPQLTLAQANEKVALAEQTFQQWKETTISERVKLLIAWQAEFLKQKESIAVSVSRQMGKPLSQARGEVETAVKRAATIVEMAHKALEDEIVTADPTSGLLRKITKEPIGVVLALCPWNYPLLCAVNSVVAATLAGNPVLLKHSDRTPLVADAFEQTFLAAGAPKGLVQAFHADHDLVAKTIANPAISYVQFTGSVAGGRAVYQATAQTRFIDVGLELGGKDPAYVTSDADLEYAVANVVDGGMYNAGQSCCAVERVYVHEKHYDAFLEGAKRVIQGYQLGNPMHEATTMGPLAQASHARFIASQVDEAVKMGARLLVGGKEATDSEGKGRFFLPTLLADCTPQMRVMSEESFGPILAVSKVSSDEEAIRLMNESDFGLTASVWSGDVERATDIARRLQAGTVFMNRCDFLDPLLAWSGRKDSGKGIGLSQHGFAPFVRTKSWNFRPNTK